MIVYFVVIQFFALLSFFLWWMSWSGKNTAWLEGRGWGWRPLFFFFGGVFLQAAFLAALAFPLGERPAPVDSDALRLLVVFMWLVVCPVALFGMFFWWPRFMLPGWIRERRRAGDPVKTAHPIPEVQHLMRKPQNTRLVSAGAGWQGGQAAVQSSAGPRTAVEEQALQAHQAQRQQLRQHRDPSGELPRLPVVFRVGTGRWWFGGIIGMVSAVALCAAVLGVPRSLFEDPSGLMNVYRTLALIGAPLAAATGLYLLHGALRPEHVTVSSESVATRSWSVSWDEIRGLSIKGDPSSHKGIVRLEVSEAAFARERKNNRWFSGRPLGMGGMVSIQPMIQMQPGLKAAPMQVAQLIETVQRGQVHGRC